MAYEPYQNCPCGSGKKLKWCCQKAAKYAEKAEQMLEKGQLANAMQALDEGLAVEPGTPLLELVKARVLLSQHDHEAAEPLIQGLLTRQPGNLPALVLRLHDQFIHQAVTAATPTLQEMRDATPTGDNEETMAWFDFTARALRAGFLPGRIATHRRCGSP